MKKLLCLLACLALLLCGCASQSMPEEEMPVGGNPLLMDAVVYYEQSEGYLVPVSVPVKLDENLLASVCQNLVANELEQLELEEAGLTALLPGDTRVYASLSEGRATVNLQSAWLGEVSDKRAKNIIRSVVGSMLQFSAVEEVAIQVNGQSARLGGQDLSQPFTQAVLNPVGKQKDNPATIYYKTVDSGLLVPVTRYLSDAEQALSAMLDPPSASLMSLFPSDAQCVKASLEEGVFFADFTGSFDELAETSKQQKLITGAALTLCQFEDVQSVCLYVNGEEYLSSDASALATFGNALE